jgi:predicted metal-binding protein
MKRDVAARKVITVFVCATCDRDPARRERPGAEGLGFLRAVRRLLRAEVDVQVKSVRCLGGCECPAAGAVNGCCSVGLAGPGRHSYVINKLDPAADGWKIREFIRLYRARRNGRIRCGESPQAGELRPHVATKVPPAPGG